MLPEYFIGAGNVHFSFLDANGDPTTWRNVGEVPVLEFNPTVDYADNFRTGKTGPNLQDLHVPVKRTANVMLTMKERTRENLEFILHGKSTSENAGNMNVAFELPGGIAAGDVILLPGDHVGITNLVLKDSAGAPATLDADNYVFDGESKLITFGDVTGLVQPIKVFSYSFKASRRTSILSETPPEVAILFDGINLAVPGQKIWARIDRVSFGASPKFSLKSGSAAGTGTEADAYELTGVVLLKPGNEQSDGYGEMRVY